MSDNEGQSKGPTSSPVVGAAIVVGGAGCLASPVVLGIAVIVVVVCAIMATLFAPFILLIKAMDALFGDGGGIRPVGGPGGGPDPQAYIKVVNGDGREKLDGTTVPALLLDHIEKSSEQCEDLGPVVIAAQLKVESDFNVKKVGPNGKQGVSQLDPEVFKKYGKDDDKNGKISPLDAADSIMAQGRYMCDLFEEVKPLADNDNPEKSQLSLALASYHVGIDAVRRAKGIPPTVDANTYVMDVRVLFPQFMGVLPPLPPKKTTSAPAPTTTQPPR
nr:lytic transglycosylase domain-containing protein [Kibdelosporangium sp. MJ126-NF4]CEL15622.1 putative peptidase [Kibdelosporangium sp. MJ126-NF4]CTQ90339.1 putative peptidase [Kibdelosporangium sp. MJ126-NF4]